MLKIIATSQTYNDCDTLTESMATCKTEYMAQSNLLQQVKHDLWLNASYALWRCAINSDLGDPPNMFIAGTQEIIYGIKIKQWRHARLGTMATRQTH